jgi:hypothetical protein
MNVDIKGSGHNSFISPFWDFVFVGGLTFLLLPILTIFKYDVQVILLVGLITYGLTFFINNPHFMFSYQILYADYGRKISADNNLLSRMRYIFSGVFVPVLLVAFYVFAYWQGLRDQGPAVLGYSINAMLFLVGWHYVKQGYGVLITLSVKKKIFYAEWEKKVLLYNGYILWIATWVALNQSWAAVNGGDRMFFGMPFSAINFQFDDAWLSFVAVVSFAVASFVFLMRAHKGALAINGWVGYFCALYAWRALIIDNYAWILVVPALHSLQYLLFVGKLSFEKRGGLHKGKAGAGWFSFLALGGMLGVMGFWAVPFVLDRIVPYNQEVFGNGMFLVMFILFINIHHYFIDFAIWRKDNPEMKFLYR